MTLPPEGAIILPLIVGPCRFVETPELSQFQAVNAPSQALSILPKHEQDEILFKLSRDVESALARV